MINQEEYEKWAPLVQEYEEAQAADAIANSLYCIECQALEEHDCFCELEHESDCNMCCGADGNHYVGCPYNTDPFDELITRGYD